MKSLVGSGEMVKGGAITAHESLQYAMSLPVATTISGIESVGVLQQSPEVTRGFQRMSASYMQALRERVQQLSADAGLNYSEPPKNMMETWGAHSAETTSLSVLRKKSIS